MKKFKVLILLLCAAASLKAQQLAPLEQSRQNQVLTNRAEHPLYFWTGPSGATPFFPAYVPDSLKCGALFYVNSTSGGYNKGQYIYNCNLAQWVLESGADVINVATDANYSVPSGLQFIKLPLITASRTVTMPDPSAYAGTTVTIWNKNTSNAYSWSFAGADVKDAAMNTIVNLLNASFYVLISDGTDWIKTN